MSAPVTEAHRALALEIQLECAGDYELDEPTAAQLIADSEAKAIDQLRAEVERLKSDGAASAFVNMSCRASRAETERNNLRADLDAIKAILTEEKGRAERAEAELATERAKVKLREAWLCGHTDGIDCGSGQRSTTDFVTFDEAEAKGHVAKYKGSWTMEGWYRAIPVRARAAIDAAMKEGTK